MDIEFHYYINYIIALKAGILPEIAHKIAYSAQYVDDNTEKYTVLEHGTLAQYSNIITQSIDPTLNFKEILSIFPVFHFIPGDEVLKSASLRRDGECRYMSTTPNNKIAQNCFKTALKSKDPYWIGIASHAYSDTWAHQNFTGIKDRYNCIDKQKHNKKSFIGLTSHIGHSNVLTLPDDPSATWYDYRLKDMKVINSERFLEAAKWLFKYYLKYSDSSMISKKPNQPEAVWNELRTTLNAIFTNDFTTLEKIFGQNCGITSQGKWLMMKILGMKKSHRLEIYQSLAKKYGAACEKYDKNKWLNKAIYDISNKVDNFGIITVNDNEKSKEIYSDVLCDSGQSTYGSSIGDMLKNKFSSMLKICNKLYMWHDKDSDWYKFQESAKKHHDYLIDKVIRVMRKDIRLMRS